MKRQMRATEEIKALLAITRGEDEYQADGARADIIIEISDHYMDRHLSRYRQKITAGGMDRDDMDQIFLIACSEAIDDAKIDVGDPLLFIMQKGKWKVVDALRRSYRRVLRQYCYHCNTETRLKEKNHTPICPNCGAVGEGVERIQVDNLDDGTVAAMIQDDHMEIPEMLASQLIVDEFRSRLTGRKADVYDLIMVQGIDRSASQNYIKEIAAVLGISAANVNLRLRQIKEDWATYIEERDLEAELV
jgi:hypothetical protein